MEAVGPILPAEPWKQTENG